MTEAIKKQIHQLYSDWADKPLAALGNRTPREAINAEELGFPIHKTAKGLRVEAEIDHTIYPAGQKVSDEQMAQINLTMESFHGEWNYTIAPLQQQLKL